jgi:3-oxoacyl-[acyl-carrier-protein] synthase-1/3-oxoacyl-[acyl-carrier-protein] synthase II
MGTISAAGETLQQAMQTMYSGKRHPAPPQNIRVELDTAYPVFEVFSARALANDRVTRTSRLTEIAANEALSMAGLTLSDLHSKRVGVAIGTTVGSTLNNESFYRRFKAGSLPDLQPVQRYLRNNPALYLSELWNLNGPAATIANACSSGTDGIGLAKSWLERGWCDVAIAGGADELSRITYLGFISLLISSAGACRPFDKERDGLNLGEGAGILILEKEETLQRRSARSLAQVCGYGTFADAYHPTAPHPEGKGLKKALHFALRQAHLSEEEVDFVNAHGTSTSNNDQVEGKVLAELFGADIPVVSTKAYTGHTLGAAGGIEAAFTVQALWDGKLPATAGFETFDPECALAPTTHNIKLNARVAVSNSLAFGGNNSTLIFRKEA